MKLNKLRETLSSLALMAATEVAMASPNNNVTLGGPSSGPLQACITMFQYIINFAGGPGAIFAVFVSLVGAIGLWMFMPKSGGAAMAWGFRISIGAILIFNLAMLIGWYESPTST